MQENMQATHTSQMQDWERCKENILPLKGGRTPAALSRTRATIPSQQQQLQKEQQHFEKKLADDSSDDPVETWLSYISWLQNAYPSGNRALLMQLLERCTRQFKDSHQYKNDVRYLKLWILYADNCADPKDIFPFLRANNIGVYNALFWEAWAVSLEQKGLMELANAAYKEGINRRAAPLARLTRHHEEFMVRFAKQAMSRSNVSLPTTPAPNNVDENGRNVLGALPTRGPVPAVRRTQAPLQASIPSTHSDAVGSGFNVFVDASLVRSSNPSHPQPLGGAVDEQAPVANPWHWRDCAYEDAATKENLAKAEKWTDFKVPQNAARVGPGHVQRAPSAAVPFQVYTEASSSVQTSKDPFAPTPQPRTRSSIKSGKERREYLHYEPAFVDRTASYGECCFEEWRAKRSLAKKPIGGTYRPAVATMNRLKRSTPQSTPIDMETTENLTATVTTMQPSPATNAMTTPASIRALRPLSRYPSAPVLGLEEKMEKKNATQDEMMARPHVAPQRALLQSQTLPQQAAPETPLIEVARESPALSVSAHSLNLRRISGSGGGSTRSLTRRSSIDEHEDTMENVTINTKKALEDVMAMFNSPMEAGGPLKPRKTTSSGAGAKVRNADVVAAELHQRQVIQNIMKAPNGENSSDAGGFEIFSEATADMRDARQQAAPPAFKQPPPPEKKMKRNALAPKELSPFDVFDECSSPDNKSGNESPNDPAESRKTPRRSAGRLSLGAQRSIVMSDDEVEDKEQHDVFEVFGKTPTRNSTVHRKKPRHSICPGTLASVDYTKLSLTLSDSPDNTTQHNTTATTSNSRRLSIVSSRNATTTIRRTPTRTSPRNAKQNVFATTSTTPPPSSAARNSSRHSSVANTALLTFDLSTYKAVPHGYRGLVDPYTKEHAQRVLRSLQTPVAALSDVVVLQGAEFPNGVQLMTPSPKHKQLSLDLEQCQLSVRKCLGQGGFSTVYLVERVDDVTGVDFLDDSTFALKVQKPVDAEWEFYVQREMMRRLPERMRCHVAQFRMLEVYDNVGFIVMDYSAHGSLQDIVNVNRLKNRRISEALCAYVTVEMLRIVAALHAVGIVHGDIKPDNFLLRHADNGNDTTTTNHEWEAWRVDQSSGGWEKRSLQLIDFGRSLDRTLYAPNTAFTGDTHVKEFMCMEMRAKRPWTTQIDTYGLCCVVHMLLHGTYMEVMRDPRTKRWRPTRSLSKRFFNVQMWEHFFDTLLNTPDCRPASQPNVDALRETLEAFLSGGAGQHVKSALCMHEVSFFEHADQLPKGF